METVSLTEIFSIIENIFSQVHWSDVYPKGHYFYVLINLGPNKDLDQL